MQPRTGLVVDDDLDVRKYLAAILKSQFTQVLEAENGVEAFAAIQKEGRDIDVVVSDIQMPEMDGITLWRNATSQFPDLPFIFITGFADVEGPQSVPLLRKPFPPQTLIQTIRTVLNV